MLALSFQGEWLDKLLRSIKQQMTRQQTDRIKAGDICNIYNQPRIMIRDKPLRRLTKKGIATMPMARYPFPSNNPPAHYAHLLGKVKITDIYDILPVQCTCGEGTWAKREGFGGYGDASTWFEAKYGERWVLRWWTVIRWDGWLERYFEPNTSEELSNI